MAAMRKLLLLLLLAPFAAAEDDFPVRLAAFDQAKAFTLEPGGQARVYPALVMSDLQGNIPAWETLMKWEKPFLTAFGDSDPILGNADRMLQQLIPGAKDQPHRVVDDLVDYVTGVNLEIVCQDDLVDEVVRTIGEAAHTGLKGDGKIYVSEVTEAVRISTGERGEAAV